MDSICGIYRIDCILTGKVYVGSAVNINRRWIRHKYLLRHNRHHSQHLQNAWNKYGEGNFKFYVIEQCDQHMLIERETYWITALDSYNNGMNVSREAGRPLGVKVRESTRQKLREVHLGKKHSTEHRLHNKESRWGGDGAGFSKTPDETREKMRRSATGNHSHAKHYIAISPEGVEYKVFNLKQFCIEHSLTSANAHQVVSGKRKSVSGWKFTKEK